MRVYAATGTNELVGLDLNSGRLTDCFSIADMPVRISNTQTDRIYLLSPTGVMQCFHEQGVSEPLAYNVVPPKVEKGKAAEKTFEKPKPKRTAAPSDDQPKPKPKAKPKPKPKADTDDADKPPPAKKIKSKLKAKTNPDDAGCAVQVVASGRMSGAGDRACRQDAQCRVSLPAPIQPKEEPSPGKHSPHPRCGRAWSRSCHGIGRHGPMDAASSAGLVSGRGRDLERELFEDSWLCYVATPGHAYDHKTHGKRPPWEGEVFMGFCDRRTGGLQLVLV